MSESVDWPMRVAESMIRGGVGIAPVSEIQGHLLHDSEAFSTVFGSVNGQAESNRGGSCVFPRQRCLESTLYF